MDINSMTSKNSGFMLDGNDLTICIDGCFLKKVSGVDQLSADISLNVLQENLLKIWREWQEEKKA